MANALTNSHQELVSPGRKNRRGSAAMIASTRSPQRGSPHLRVTALIMASPRLGGALASLPPAELGGSCCPQVSSPEAGVTEHLGIASDAGALPTQDSLPCPQLPHTGPASGANQQQGQRAAEQQPSMASVAHGGASSPPQPGAVRPRPTRWGLRSGTAPRARVIIPPQLCGCPQAPISHLSPEGQCSSGSWPTVPRIQAQAQVTILQLR